MSRVYSEAVLDEARLRLIDSMPEESDSTCRPFGGEFWQSPHECQGARIEGHRIIAEELSLHEITARSLLDGYDNLPSYHLVDGKPVRLTEQERIVGECMLRKALGVCPLGVKHD